MTQRPCFVNTDLRLYVNFRHPSHRQPGVNDLVLLAFNNDAEQRNQLPYIIHINGDETNNHLGNLQRATYEQYHEADDNQRDNENLPRRRIIRSRRMNALYDPLLLPSHPDYVRRRYIYQDGQVSTPLSDGQVIRQRVNLAGTAFVQISLRGVSRWFPVDEMMVDTWRGFGPNRRDIIHNDHFATNLRWVTPQQNTSFSHAVRMRAYRADLSQEQVFDAIADATGFHFNDRTFPVTTIKDYMKKGIALHGWHFVRENDTAAERQEELQLLKEDQGLPTAEGEAEEVIEMLNEEADPLQEIQLE